MGASLYSTLSLIEPILTRLKKKVLESDEKATQVVQEFKDAALKDRKDWYKIKTLQSLMAQATFLDPLWKEFCHIRDKDAHAEWLRFAKEQLLSNPFIPKLKTDVDAVISSNVEQTISLTAKWHKGEADVMKFLMPDSDNDELNVNTSGMGPAIDIVAHLQAELTMYEAERVETRNWAVGLLKTCIAPLSHAVSASAHRVIYSSHKRPVQKSVFIGRSCRQWSTHPPYHRKC